MLNISDTLHLIKTAPTRPLALAVLGGFLALGLLCSSTVSADGAGILLGTTSVACDDNQPYPPFPNLQPNVTPITGHIGDTYEVTINGFDFCKVSLADGNDIASHLNDIDNEDPTIAPLNSKLTFTLNTVGGPSTYLMGGLDNTLFVTFIVLNPLPLITGISPATGDINGGTAITITGSEFVTGAKVTVGGVLCTNPTVVSATSLTCTTGARRAGNADVLVANPDTQTGRLAAAFVYTDPSDLDYVLVTANTASVNFGTLATVSYSANGFISPETFKTKPVCRAYKTSDKTFAHPLALSKTTPVGTYVTHCKSAKVNTIYTLGYIDGTVTIAAVLPDAPKNVKATAGNTSASISFSAPASNGGSPITRYTVVSNTAITVTGTKSPLTVTGLQNGLSYTFKVMATNSQGDSVYSTFSAPIKPALPGRRGHKKSAIAS